METNTATTVQPLSITESAVAQLERIKNEQNLDDDHMLRVGVKGGGCSGFSYILGFDTAKERDEHYTIGNFNVLIDKAHAIYLLGIEIDWLDGLNNRGFTFNNPNAKETCGCGTSFSA
jgi:iron-sulfur cluster assembly protein